MGKYVGSVTTIRSTGRGSDLYGRCDQCGKHMAECVVWERRRVFQRDDGSRYSAPFSGGAYGHKDCLEKHFGKADIDDSDKLLCG